MIPKTTVGGIQSIGTGRPIRLLGVRPFDVQIVFDTAGQVHVGATPDQVSQLYTGGAAYATPAGQPLRWARGSELWVTTRTASVSYILTELPADA